ncbi:MAG: FHA domain-containing protein [Chloroflexota bacterium]
MNLEGVSNSVSRCQAELFEAEGAFWLRPLSANSMWLNGEIIPFNPQAPDHSEPVQLNDGDQIDLGFKSVVLTCYIPPVTEVN